MTTTKRHTGSYGTGIAGWGLVQPPALSKTPMPGGGHMHPWAPSPGRYRGRLIGPSCAPGGSAYQQCTSLAKTARHTVQHGGGGGGSSVVGGGGGGGGDGGLGGDSGSGSAMAVVVAATGDGTASLDEMRCRHCGRHPLGPLNAWRLLLHGYIPPCVCTGATGVVRVEISCLRSSRVSHPQAPDTGQVGRSSHKSRQRQRRRRWRRPGRRHSTVGAAVTEFVVPRAVVPTG